MAKAVLADIDDTFATLFGELDNLFWTVAKAVKRARAIAIKENVG
jgi:hypothetical protein